MKMNFGKTASRLAMAVAASLALTGTASAVDYNVIFDKVTPSSSSTGGTGVFHGFVQDTTPIGPGRPELWGGDDDNGSTPTSGDGYVPVDSFANTFWAWCLQPDETVRLGTTYTYTLAALESAPITKPGSTMGSFAVGSGDAADAMRLLVWTLNDDLDGTIAALGSANQVDLRAAFQLALWEIANERTLAYDVLDDGTGSFNVNNTDFDGNGVIDSYGTAVQRTLANLWLADIVDVLDGGTRTGTDFTWLTSGRPLAALTNAEKQDFLVGVPLPAGAWLFGSALLGILGVSRRRRAAAVA